MSEPLSPCELLARLDELGIASSTIEHAPAFTVHDGEEVMGHLPGVHIKNLFLCDAKKAMWLVTVPWNRQVDLKKLPGLIGAARLSFGSAERLKRVLGVEPGSVTPFATINDTTHQVQVILDAWMMAQEVINAHPLVNCMTTSLKSADLMKFFAATGHQPRLVNLGGTP